MKTKTIRCSHGVVEVVTPKYIIVFNVDGEGCNGGPVTLLRVMERRPEGRTPHQAHKS